MGLFFVCKKYAADGKNSYGDIVPVEDIQHSIDDRGRAEKLALKKFTDSGCKEEYFVAEAVIVYKPAIVNALGGTAVEPEALVNSPRPATRPVDGATRTKQPGPSDQRGG